MSDGLPMINSFAISGYGPFYDVPGRDLRTFWVLWVPSNGSGTKEAQIRGANNARLYADTRRKDGAKMVAIDCGGKRFKWWPPGRES